MISSFLKKDKEDKNSFIFNFVQFSNSKQPDSNLCDFIRTSILKSYMEEDLNKDFLKKYDLEKIKGYIKNTIIADNKNRFDKNVREGDLGEVMQH